MLSYDEFKRLSVRHNSALMQADTKINKSNSLKRISVESVIPDIKLSGDWFQFGVFKGYTANLLLSHLPKGSNLHLFDSFEGLPEDWTGTNFGQGHFKLEKGEIPTFDPEKTRLHKGWFHITVPRFVKDYNKPIPFIHMDADLYSSTIEVLNGLNHLIVPGTILLFDEYFMQGKRKNIINDEARACHDWAKAKSRKFQHLWRTKWMQCAIQILE